MKRWGTLMEDTLTGSSLNLCHAVKGIRVGESAPVGA